MIPQSFIQGLLARVDITDVVGRHVQLKKAGANYLGLCPFHNEKSPSFTVSPSKQFFHCFGCGAHGSAIGFLMEHSGASYVEAIRDLAQSVGMTVPEEENRVSVEQRKARQDAQMALTQVMSTACDYYRKQLRLSDAAKNYLKGRGLTGEIAARFGLGFAPDAWQNLEGEFGSYRDDAVAKPLVESGLVIESEKTESDGKHRRYDRFRGRVMFPIRNVKGAVIGFGGRVMDGCEPKYLNSPETPLFSKGNELYGLFEARAVIREMGYVLVTEGYMDVVALAQMGFANAVATLGTACTPMHVQKLFRQIDNVVFSFDGDAAGRRAARRALEACLPLLADDKTVRFLFLASEHDPDSYIREEGAQAFDAAVAQAMPLSQFLLKSVAQDLNLRQPEGRARAQFQAKPLLQAMPPIGLRLQIIRSLAEMTGSTSAEVEAVCELKPVAASRYAAPKPRVKRAPPTGLEQQLMRMLMRFPELAGELDAQTRAALATPDGANSELLADLFAHCDQSKSFAALSDLLAQSPFEGAYQGLREAVLKDDIDLDAARAELQGAASKLVTEGWKQEQRRLAQLIEAGRASDADREAYRRFAEWLQQEKAGPKPVD
ncbi:MAG: DNA primase [Candidatus Protistobacter heckmanni]|nr:DNA primase [Candidatus Protistobacter heckmanni]MCS6764863.1 DNA primase [Candidatus Protistobacter heckmanni]